MTAHVSAREFNMHIHMTSLLPVDVQHRSSDTGLCRHSDRLPLRGQGQLWHHWRQSASQAWQLRAEPGKEAGLYSGALPEQK